IVNTNGVMRVGIQTPGLSTTTCVIEWDPKQGLDSQVKLIVVDGVVDIGASIVDTAFTVANMIKTFTSSGNDKLMALVDAIKLSTSLIAIPGNIGDDVPLREVLKEQGEEYLKGFTKDPTKEMIDEMWKAGGSFPSKEMLNKAIEERIQTLAKLNNANANYMFISNDAKFKFDLKYTDGKWRVNIDPIKTYEIFLAK
ncbi:MAG: hypothetical protein AAB267_06620, partial [Candidatus Desantisbacteria bacterium]